MAAACEALARAHAVGGDRIQSDHWAARAREACASITAPQDREVIERDLASVPH